MKIALVHDYLREYGGAERVVETFHEMWPEAPLYTSFVDWPSFAKAPAGKVELFKSWDIRTSWIADNWFMRKFHSPLRFLAPLIWKSIDVSEYDLVISSSGWFMCRGIKTQKSKLKSQNWNSQLTTQNSQLHICYIHHPPRNLYGYPTGSTLQKYWPVRLYAAIINFFLRHYDFDTAQKVDYFIANSKETARRVEKFYRRKSTVIYPPIETVHRSPLTVHSNIKRDYYLSVGRLTYSKRVDLAIDAANELKLPLKIVGTGPEEKNLKSLSGSTVEFLGAVSDEELVKLYSNAKALIFCALDEDFGMVPVEAMAHGTPVVALAQGGVLETVIEGKTGVFFEKPRVDELMKAIRKFEELEILGEEWEKNCKRQAMKFSKERFKKELQSYIHAIMTC